MRNYLLCFMIFFSISTFGLPDNKDGKKLNKPSYKEGDSYIMNINNFYLPLNNAGVIAAGSDIGGRIRPALMVKYFYSHPDSF